MKLIDDIQAQKLFELLCVPFEQNEIDSDKGADVKPVQVEQSIQVVQEFNNTSSHLDAGLHISRTWTLNISGGYSFQIIQRNYTCSTVSTEIKLYHNQQVIITKIFNDNNKNAL